MCHSHGVYHRIGRRARMIPLLKIALIWGAKRSAGWAGWAADARALHQLRRAASIAAMSIFFISIIASNARLAAAGSGSLIACVNASGVICQDRPHLSLHQPHAL